MNSLNIPYDKITVDQETIERVYFAIDRKASEKPDSSIDIQSISNDLRFTPATVKETFLILHLYGYLKATFLPRCKKCDKVIGEPAESVEILYNKADQGEFDFCVGCYEEIVGREGLTIQLLFWLPKIEKR
jgi:hypothetical protein